jgi:hypothetical protein
VQENDDQWSKNWIRDIFPALCLFADVKSCLSEQELELDSDEMHFCLHPTTLQDQQNQVLEQELCEQPQLQNEPDEAVMEPSIEADYLGRPVADEEWYWIWV